MNAILLISIAIVLAIFIIIFLSFFPWKVLFSIHILSKEGQKEYLKKIIKNTFVISSGITFIVLLTLIILLPFFI
jgi:hypothetical protein